MSIDWVPVVMMAVAGLLILVSIVILWPDLNRERKADAEETRRLQAAQASAEAQSEPTAH
jgi:hypothetical protein